MTNDIDLRNKDELQITDRFIVCGNKERKLHIMSQRRCHRMRVRRQHGSEKLSQAMGKDTYQIVMQNFFVGLHLYMDKHQFE